MQIRFNIISLELKSPYGITHDCHERASLPRYEKKLVICTSAVFNHDRVFQQDFGVSQENELTA